MWENSAAAFPIQGRRLVPHVELFDSSFILNYAFKLLFECLFSSSWDEGKFLRVYYLSSVIAGKNLRIVWKENSQMALILFHTFDPPRCLLKHCSFSKLGNGMKHRFVFLFVSPYLSTWRMHKSTFHTSTALSLDKTNPQNCTCQLFRWDEKNTDLFFFLCLVISQNDVFNLS